ncbi:hypothetical protein GIB67_016550 [Kingdonia uniflora]|uniref:Uncharacterized protein n=1 Tax=Kingdonia uniflora TaxID=39325 RepID=A0A7J7NQQ5_9MAGN|nr:hypothetical protein GIB67_016550 [Kingdonia uniflora]
MLKRGSTSGTPWSGEVEEEAIKKRVDPSFELIGVKVTENLPGKDELKVVKDRARLAARKGVKEMSKVDVRLMKGICLRMEEEKVDPESGKAELEKKVAQLKSNLVWEGKRLASVKAAQEEHKDMRLRIKELENELVKEKDTSVSLLTSQAELQVKLESTRLSEEQTRQYNQEFTAEFDRTREENEDREDQHVKVHFKFVEVTQTVDNLTRKIEKKDAKISKGQKEPAETKEETVKLKTQNDALMVKRVRRRAWLNTVSKH